MWVCRFFEESFVVGRVRVFRRTVYYPANLYNPSVSSRLLHMSAILSALGRRNVSIKHCGLADTPLGFIRAGTIASFLRRRNPRSLPLVLISNAIRFTNHCPAGSRFTDLVNFSPTVLRTTRTTKRDYYYNSDTRRAPSYYYDSTPTRDRTSSYYYNSTPTRPRDSSYYYKNSYG